MRSICIKNYKFGATFFEMNVEGEILFSIKEASEWELLTLRLADQVSAVVEDEQSVADKALNIAKQNINK